MRVFCVCEKCLHGITNKIAYESLFKWWYDAACAFKNLSLNYWKFLAKTMAIKLYGLLLNIALLPAESEIAWEWVRITAFKLLFLIAVDEKVAEKRRER